MKNNMVNQRTGNGQPTGADLASADGRKPDGPILFSFFSGLGFLDLGFEKAGYRSVFVNEFRPPFLAAYKYARTQLKISAPDYGYFEGDVSKFIAEKRSWLASRVKEARQGGRLVGFIGGPPCPDFSIGGKNKGREGERGKLSHTYVQLILEQKPDFFLFENVKGLWQTKRHREFYEELKTQLQDGSYITTERLINSIEYAAPQDRPRIILIGFRRGVVRDLGVRLGSGIKELPPGLFPWHGKAKYPDGRAFEFSWPETTRFEVDSEQPRPADLPDELTVQHWFRKNDVANHPNSLHCFKPRAGLARFMSVAEGDDSRKSFKRLHRWRYSPTVCYGNNEVHLHPYKPRRISAAEALALQSLPKEYVLPDDMSLSDMFKGIGNGVPFLAGRAIAETILTFLENPHESNGVRSRESDSPSTPKPLLSLRQRQDSHSTTDSQC